MSLPIEEVRVLFRHCLARFAAAQERRGNYLAALAPGESMTMPNKRELDNKARLLARKELGDSNAQWRARMTNHGLRITRVR